MILFSLGESLLMIPGVVASTDAHRFQWCALVNEMTI